MKSWQHCNTYNNMQQLEWILEWFWYPASSMSIFIMPTLLLLIGNLINMNVKKYELLLCWKNLIIDYEPRCNQYVCKLQMSISYHLKGTTFIIIWIQKQRGNRIMTLCCLPSTKCKCELVFTTYQSIYALYILLHCISDVGCYFQVILNPLSAPVCSLYSCGRVNRLRKVWWISLTQRDEFFSTSSLANPVDCKKEERAATACGID